MDLFYCIGMCLGHGVLLLNIVERRPWTFDLGDPVWTLKLTHDDQ